MSNTLVCSKCGKEKRETDFFKTKTGERCDMCKSCLTMYIDNSDSSTFLWILEKFDVPYIEKTWIAMSNKIYMKNPGKFGPASVIGQYLRSMKMSQYSEYCYADSDKLNFENKKLEQEAAARRLAAGRNEEFEEQLQQKLEEGTISEAEYNTLSANATPQEKFQSEQLLCASAPIDIDEGAIRRELSDEDIKYLALKWGVLYKPSEWVKMEEMYQKYASENELNIDREETLKKICKTSLKMDQALDVGDILNYKSLSNVYDQLRKSAKFTEAQNKEEEVRDLDSIGELVALVEREGGIIPCWEVTDEYPQDRIDFTIKDMQNYVNNLVRNELGLGELIETYIEKEDQRIEQTADDIMKNSFKEYNEDDELLSELEAINFQDFFLAEADEQEAKLLEGDA